MGDVRQIAIGGKRRQRSRRAAGIDGNRFAAGGHDKPEAITAQAIHMGIDHGNGGRCRDHRFNRATAIAQHRQRALAGKMMGGNRHSVYGDITLHEQSS